MTVSDQIIQVLDALCEKFGIVVDWTSANVVPYVATLCTKLVSYEIWTSAAIIAFMVVLCIASIIATKICYPTFKKGWKANSESFCDCGWQVASICAVIGLVILYSVAIGCIGDEIMDIIKCATFPEMYVFEYVQSLIKA